MNSRTILSVAYPFAKISEKTAGGAEQILKTLDQAITMSGNRSIVLAQRGSLVSGEIIECDSECNRIDDFTKTKIYKEYLFKLTHILRERKIDLIHFHGLDFAQYFPSAHFPSLVTLHLPLDWYKAGSLSLDGVNFNCVSRFQLNKSRGMIKGVVTLIENGVTIPEKIQRRETGAYTLSMGRICPEKGFHLAIEASRRANVPFILAGRVYPYNEHIDYFKSKIKPAIDSKECTFVGEVGNDEKKRLLRRASCLLVPSLVEETSSLVAMEAMAYGVPVIAFRAGALNELIRHAENGYLVNDEKEMAEAISKIERIDSARCYSLAKENYSVTRMTSQYLQLYEKIISVKK